MCLGCPTSSCSEEQFGRWSWAQLLGLPAFTTFSFELSWTLQPLLPASLLLLPGTDICPPDVGNALHGNGRSLPTPTVHRDGHCYLLLAKSPVMLQRLLRETLLMSSGSWQVRQGTLLDMNEGAMSSGASLCTAGTSLLPSPFVSGIKALKPLYLCLTKLVGDTRDGGGLTVLSPACRTHCCSAGSVLCMTAVLTGKMS